MNIWTRLDSYQGISKKPLILALGNFDGLHLGHERILRSVVENSKKINGITAVLTFFEHPQRVLHDSSEPALLTSSQHRLYLFHQMGIELCFFLHFSVPFSKTNPEDFVENCLVKKLGVKEVHLGYNAHFGFNREGDSSVMKKLSSRLGFSFFEMEPVKVGEEFISSTLIRQAVRAGDLARAKKMLGRPFSIYASVVRGKGRGTGLGFPTANLRPHSEILPPRGVYPVEVRENLYHLQPLTGSSEFKYVLEKPGKWYPGVLNFGTRPTFESGSAEPIPEVFLFNFTGNLYGKTVEVVFHPKLRDEKFFEDSGALTRSIEEDVLKAKRYFASASQA